MKAGMRTAAAIAVALAGGCGGGGDQQAPAATLGASGTRPAPAWTIDAPFENLPGKAEYPAVAIGDGGDTLAVFAQQADTRVAVFAVHGNVNAASIGPPRMIDHPAMSAQPGQRAGGRFMSNTQVAMHPAKGDAIAVWSASTDGHPRIWAAKYTRASDTWHAPQRLDASSSSATYPMIAMNAQGNAIATWSEPGSVSAAYYANGTWSSPTRLSSGTAGTPQAGIDDAGNAWVAWVENENIVASRITQAGAASPARILDALPAPASMPSLAVAPNGNALVTWLQDDGTGSSVRAARFADGSWSAPAAIESHPGGSFAPFAALNDRGGFVAWEQETPGASSASAYAVRLDASGAWSAPVNVYNRGGFMPVVRLRDNGDAMMVWLAAHTQYATWSASTGTWSEVVNLAPYNCGAGHALAMDSASGTAIAAWIPSNCGRNNDVYGAFYR